MNIGTFVPSDPKSQDITELVGSIDLARVGEFGAESDPRAYRFDAKGGFLSFRGETKLTNKGEAFTFIPIAYRIFADEILGYDLRNWVEFYFINHQRLMYQLVKIFK